MLIPVVCASMHILNRIDLPVNKILLLKVKEHYYINLKAKNIKQYQFGLPRWHMLNSSNLSLPCLPFPFGNQ